MQRLALALLVAAIAAMAAAIPADAVSRGRCLKGGPKCWFWKAKVDHVADGDTLRADIAGDHKKKIESVRFINVQAMELHRYSRHPERRRGECHGLEATANLERIVKAHHKRIRLGAQHKWSRAGGPHGRLRRYVQVKVKGHWRDVGEMQIRQGHALWMADTIEYAYNARYNVAQQRAALAGKNLWNPTHCGVGPHQNVPIKVWVNWDPVGNDVKNRNDEFMKIQNRSATTPLPLGGWWVRDAQYGVTKVPKGIVIQPGHTYTVRAGNGKNTATTLYRRLDYNPFQNPGDFRHLGDGGYLFDPKGDLRAYMLYPCRVKCSDPNKGAFRVFAQPSAPEYAEFTNITQRSIDLYGYAMTTHGSTYPFPENSLVHPGETIRVYISGDPRDDSRLVKHWGRSGTKNLPNSGGWVHLETFTDITLGCDSWGSGRC